MRGQPRKSRIGEKNRNRYGSEMSIIKYQNSSNIWVEFKKDNYIVKTDYNRFRRGAVINVYDKSYLGIGFIGEGIHKTRENGKITREFSDWCNMFKRCYDELTQEKHSSYRDCEVDQEWHNFQKFADWHKSNFYEIKGERMQLDKDIIEKGNRVYSPESCVFAPAIINSLFGKSKAARGDLPIGVSWDKGKSKYEAYYQFRRKRRHLGYYHCSNKAFLAYKEGKEQLIKEVANEYKDRIPLKLYNALYEYEVEITD